MNGVPRDKAHPWYHKYGVLAGRGVGGKFKVFVCSTLDTRFVIMFTLKFLAFVGAVQGLPWDGVKPTGVFDQPFGLHQQPPKPTQAAVDLRKRQAAGDVTCGYEDGISCMNSEALP